MIEKLKVSYENMETSSYLAIAYPQESNPVHYQEEMIISNEIPHFLKASKRTVNGEMLMYYNISSRITLAQILGRRKLKREELIRITEGAIAAIKEAGEYQLLPANIVMKPEYIYVEPASCEPDFLYLPVQSADEKGLKEFLLDLIMQGMLEMSNDNFVQVLLEAVNSQPLSVERIEECIRKKTFGREAGRRVPLASQAAHPVIQPIAQPLSPVPPAEPALISPEPSQKKPPAVPKNQKTKKEKKQKEKNPKAEAASNGGQKDFDPEKAKKKFMLPQAIIMIAVCAMISFGAFTDAAGHIAMDVVAATAIAVTVTEIILYREAYVNSKKPKSAKSSGNTKLPTSAEGKGRPRPQPPIPARVPVQQTAPEPARPQMPIRPPVAPAAPTVPPAVSCFPPVPPFRQQSIVSGGEDDTELWDRNQTGMTAYLEYYDNGILTRIPLDKPSILIGRLEGQVDFVLSNPKVGKVHAEFLIQDGVVYVKDLNSKNGTYINGSGERIGSNIPYPLHANDKITLADSDLVLRC